MAKRVKFTATWSNGNALTRTSDCKEYTHAWWIVVERVADGYRCEKFGFSANETLAHKAARSEFASFLPATRGKWAGLQRGTQPAEYRLVSSEVVAVVREG